MNRTIIIGSRGSKLALWQANYTQNQLATLGIKSEIKIITTKGDAIQHLSFNKMEGKGFFTKEIEDALLNGDIDLAVHSFKDLPTHNVEGLLIAACSYRENPFDCLCISPSALDLNLPLHLKENATVGTSAARRKAQLRALRPDLNLVDIRGNVPTRLAKAGSELDAVVLAAAGLQRLQLNLSQYHIITLDPTLSVPAPAQGVLAFQIRQSDTDLYPVISQLNQPDVSVLVGIERKIMQQLGGGCQHPIGVYCTKTNGRYQLWASKAESEHDFPQRSFIESTRKEGLVKKTVNRLLESLGKSVFISRALAPDDFFYRAMQQRNYTLVAQSLVQFEPVPFTNSEKVDWIFFSSKNGVKFFFEQQPNLEPNIKLAALGSGTAKMIKQYGGKVNFEGSGHNITEIAQQFGRLAHQQRVLFPQAENSVQSVQQVLQNTLACVNLIVYRNTPLTQFTLPTCNILVFTSPLNVKAYCSKINIDPQQQVIAIGKTTAQTLVEFGCLTYTLPYEPNEISLADVCW